MKLTDLVRLFESRHECAEALGINGKYWGQIMQGMLDRDADVALLADGRYVVLNQNNKFCEVNCDDE